jgi:hypothetical protein
MRGNRRSPRLLSTPTRADTRHSDWLETPADAFSGALLSEVVTELVGMRGGALDVTDGLGVFVGALEAFLGGS